MSTFIAEHPLLFIVWTLIVCDCISATFSRWMDHRATLRALKGEQ